DFDGEPAGKWLANNRSGSVPGATGSVQGAVTYVKGHERHRSAGPAIAGTRRGRPSRGRRIRVRGRRRDPEEGRRAPRPGPPGPDGRRPGRGPGPPRPPLPP